MENLALLMCTHSIQAQHCYNPLQNALLSGQAAAAYFTTNQEQHILQCSPSERTVIFCISQTLVCILKSMLTSCAFLLMLVNLFLLRNIKFLEPLPQLVHLCSASLIRKTGSFSHVTMQCTHFSSTNNKLFINP